MIKTRYSRLATIFTVIALCAALGIALIVTSTVSDNCGKIHRLYSSIDKILVSNQVIIGRSKTITPTQKKEYLKFNKDNRVLLARGDCR